MQLAQPRSQHLAQRRLELLSRLRILFSDPCDRVGIVGRLEAAKRVGDGDAVQDVDQIGARSDWVLIQERNHGGGYRRVAAKTAAPSSPDSAFRITFTGIADSIASSGGFARNARIKSPVVRAGRIFGAIPPPM